MLSTNNAAIYISNLLYIIQFRSNYYIPASLFISISFYESEQWNFLSLLIGQSEQLCLASRYLVF